MSYVLGPGGNSRDFASDDVAWLVFHDDLGVDLLPRPRTRPVRAA